MIDRRYRRRGAIVAAISLSGLATLVAPTPPAGFAAQLQPDVCKLFTPKEAQRILGKEPRREANLRGVQGSECIYAAKKDDKRVVRVALGEFASNEEASNAWARARAKAQFDRLKIENVRRVAQRAYWLPQTNNFERTVLGESAEFGELTTQDGRRVYSVFITPPSKKKARDAFNLMTAD